MCSIKHWFLLLQFIYIYCNANLYTYGAHRWGKIFPDCVNPKQSPIDIIDEYTGKSQLFLLRTCFEQTTFNDHPIIFISGHSVTLSFDTNRPNNTWNEPLVRTVFGFMVHSYILEKITFHWGSNDTNGSEHTINGNVSSMEMQIYFRENIYDDFAEARTYMNGVLAFSVLVDVATEPKNGHKFFDFIKNIDIGYGIESKYDFGNITFDEIFPLESGFYHYIGSLTTPPCSGNILWVVLIDRLQISSENLAIFRQVKSFSTILTENIRPIQPIGTRKVFKRANGPYIERCSNKTEYDHFHKVVFHMSEKNKKMLKNALYA